MPIDNAGKRRSLFGWGVQPVGLIPDGTIDAPDRLHVSGRYCGIALLVQEFPLRIGMRFPAHGNPAIRIND